MSTHTPPPTPVAQRRIEHVTPTTSRLAYGNGNSSSQYLPSPRESGAFALSLPEDFSGLEERVGGDEYVEEEDEPDTADLKFDEYKSSMDYGKVHPGILVEAASLSACAPPQRTYYPKFLEQQNQKAMVLDQGVLSQVQLENIVYASMKHETMLPNGKERAGFLIGDGTGVGKGRSIAGLILENWVQGRKRALWVSVSGDLSKDAERDLRDIGASINVKLLKSPIKVTDSINHEGVLFLSYTMLSRGSGEGGDDDDDANEDVALADGKPSRLKQVIDWCGGREFEGLLIFDESHKAKNLLPAKRGENGSVMGLAVKKIQDVLPKARVVYVSATSATEPRNMAYMTRLGLWGSGCPFDSVEDFLEAMDKRGARGMECVATDMKAMGLYMARSLSFNGVDFEICEAEMDESFIRMYERAAELWSALKNFVDDWTPQNKKKGDIGKYYWNAFQRFFKGLCLSAKVKKTIQLAEEARRVGYAVVIGLQGTGEAASEAKAARDPDSDDLAKPAEETFRRVIDYVLEMNGAKEAAKKPKKTKSAAVPLSSSELEVLKAKAKELEDQIVGLGLPENPLDLLIDGLGRKSKVAELTGRKKRWVRNTPTGPFEQEARESNANINECKRFQEGTKLIAIISEAASAGISLHADKVARNKLRRFHITIELPWSADKALQQLGRTHRSNQVSEPSYKLVITDLGGERRFISTVAKRLGSLGAITLGDANATNVFSIASFNFETKEGSNALAMTQSIVSGYGRPAPSGMDVPEAMTKEEFFACVREEFHRLDLQDDNVRKFLNRLLGVKPIKVQNALFDLFLRNFKEAMLEAQKNGDNAGIEDIGGQHCIVTCPTPPKIVHTDPHSKVETKHLLLKMDRGLTFDAALQILENAPVLHRDAGWYRPKSGRGKNVFLAVAVDAYRAQIYKPHLGMDRILPWSAVRFNTEKMPGNLAREKIQPVWSQIYASTESQCVHLAWGQNCARARDGQDCVVGMRKRDFNVLVGAILPVWKMVEDGLDGQKVKLVRTTPIKTTTDGEPRRLIGIHVPASKIDNVLAALYG